MDLAGVVQGAVARDRVKGAGVGDAEVLHLAGDGGQRLNERHADHLVRHLPGRPAGGAPYDGKRHDPAPCHLDLEFRHPELFAIGPQLVAPAKAAAGKRGDGVFDFATGGDHRDAFLLADVRQVVAEVRVLDEAEDQISVEVRVDVVLRFVDKFRQRLGDIEDGGDGDAPAVTPDPFDFFLSGAPVFKDHDAGWGVVGHGFSKNNVFLLCNVRSLRPS